MRIVFMGTPDFAVPSLLALHDVHEVVSVYSRPDRPAGRGRHVVATPVKVAAHAAGIAVRQPESLRVDAVIDELRKDRPDLIVVAAFGAILPKAVLDIPTLGCLNVHASLLPRWRGAAPIQRAILAGDAETGVCIMRIEEGLDTGPWCARTITPVDAKDAPQLDAALASAGADLLLSAVSHLIDGSLVWHDQDDSEATYAPKLTKADVAIAPDLTSADVLARVRASGPSAPCRMRIGDRGLTVLRAVAADEVLSPGVARCADSLVLGCADGSVRLVSVVPAGKGAMDGEAFARGARLGNDCTWSAR
jgi:methionyl-tRNA formyltransferase